PTHHHAHRTRFKRLLQEARPERVWHNSRVGLTASMTCSCFHGQSNHRHRVKSCDEWTWVCFDRSTKLFSENGAHEVAIVAVSKPQHKQVIRELCQDTFRIVDRRFLCQVLQTFTPAKQISKVELPWASLSAKR